MSVDYGMLNVEMLKCGAGCVKTGAIEGEHTYIRGGHTGADGGKRYGGKFMAGIELGKYWGTSHVPNDKTIGRDCGCGESGMALRLIR